MKLREEETKVNSHVKRARHVGIVVSSMNKALKFYQDLLGLKIVKHLIEEGEYIDRLLGVSGARLDTYKLSASGDDFVIELMEVTSHPDGPPANPTFTDIGASHVAFEVTDIEGLYKKLSKANVRFHSVPQASPYDPVKTVFALDPDGTIVQFVEFLKGK